MDQTLTSNQYEIAIIDTPAGFLVGEGLGSENAEVTETANGFSCDCFFAKASYDGQCDHISAVKDRIKSIKSSELEPISQARADFHLSQVAEIDHLIQQNLDSAVEQQKQIDDWLQSETDKLERKKSYYTQSLENWMRLSDFSTKKLVHGQVKLRKQQPELEITDEAALLVANQFVRLIPEKKTIDKSALRKHVVSTGEEVPGVVVHLRDAKFTYTTNNPMGGMKNGIG